MQHFRGLFSGRSPRKAWWTWASVVFLVIGASLHFEALLPKAARGWLYLFLAILPLCLLAPITVRRLHDRGRPGWTAVFFLTPSILGEIASRAGYLRGGFDAMTPVYIYLAMTGLFFLWYVVEMGILRGTVGANRFGADPVGTAAERYAAIISRQRTAPSKKALVAAFMHDLELLATHKLKTAEDLTADVIRRGPPFRLDAIRLLVVPLLAAGAINAAIRAAANPYSMSMPDYVGFWPIWVLLVPAWLIGEYFIAMPGWEGRVKAANPQDAVATATSGA